MVNGLVTLIVLFIIFLAIRLLFIKKVPADTPAGAIVMGSGIFINGAMKNIPFLERNASQLFTIILLLFWILIWSSFAKTFLKKTFMERHLSLPIKSFAIGTWVAGTSVCWIAVYQRLTWLAPLAGYVLLANILLWIFYMGICFRGYSDIIKKNLLDKVNGVLLISTVSTQSLVVLGSTVYGVRFPVTLSRFMILWGAALYVFAFILVFRRYFFKRSWSFEDDWQNTNCIMHGAMSITGLASTVSGAVSGNIILIIWLWVILWFVIVESMELYRAWKRIKKYGFVRGVVVYDVTQWSRIFTFGMLYTFTMRFKLAAVPNATASMLNLQSFILKYGTWLMVIILICEGFLFFKDESVRNPTST